MDVKGLTAKEREKIVAEIKQAPAVGGIPVTVLVKAVGDYVYITENYDLDD